MQQTFQVMGVLNVPCCVRVARLQQRLHLIEQSGLNDGLVRAGVKRALVADHPGVVRVRQHAVEGILPQRLRRTLWRRHRHQASRREVAEQRSHGSLALGVGLERPRDQRGAFGIDLDCAYFAALFVGPADVEVADRCPHRGAALRDLLRQALGDLGGKVPAVELRDGRHDAVDEHPRRRLVDGLGRRHERDSGVDEGFVNLHIVGAVAGEPIKLMHDAEGNAGRGDERQHVLQPVTIRRPSGLPSVYELAHDPCAQLGGLPCVGFALSGDREAFLGAAALGLLPRRHPQVRDGQQHGRFGGVLGSLGVECRGAHAGASLPGCFLVPILSRTPDKPKSSTARRRQIVGRRQPEGVRLTVHPRAVPGFGDAEHPLDQLRQVRLITPRHTQPQTPILASHDRQVHRPPHNAHFRPLARHHFEVTRLLQIEESPLTSVTKQTYRRTWPPNATTPQRPTSTVATGAGSPPSNRATRPSCLKPRWPSRVSTSVYSRSSPRSIATSRTRAHGRSGSA